MKLLRIISVDSDVTDKVPITYSAFVTYWKRNGNMMGQYISYLQTSRKLMTQIEKYCKTLSLNFVYP
jgi:hypothetical protein